MNPSDMDIPSDIEDEVQQAEDQADAVPSDAEPSSDSSASDSSSDESPESSNSINSSSSTSSSSSSSNAPIDDSNDPTLLSNINLDSSSQSSSDDKQSSSSSQDSDVLNLENANVVQPNSGASPIPKQSSSSAPKYSFASLIPYSDEMAEIASVAYIEVNPPRYNSFFGKPLDGVIASGYESYVYYRSMASAQQYRPKYNQRNNYQYNYNNYSQPVQNYNGQYQYYNNGYYYNTGYNNQNYSNYQQNYNYQQPQYNNYNNQNYYRPQSATYNNVQISNSEASQSSSASENTNQFKISGKAVSSYKSNHKDGLIEDLVDNLNKPISAGDIGLLIYYDSHQPQTNLPGLLVESHYLRYIKRGQIRLAHPDLIPPISDDDATQVVTDVGNILGIGPEPVDNPSSDENRLKYARLFSQQPVICQKLIKGYRQKMAQAEQSDNSKK